MALAVLVGMCSQAIAQTIKLYGTPTCFRALREISEEYRKAHVDASFDLRFGGSFGAVERLGKGEIDIACIEFPLRKYVDVAWGKAMKAAAPPTAEHTFAQTALGIVVNNKNNLLRLTYDQARDVLSGKAAFWRDAGGSGGRIKVLTSKALSRTMTSDLLRDEWGMPR